MRYFTSAVFLILLSATDSILPAREAPRKRPAGKQSSIASVRKPQKLKVKPLVYNPKTNRPVVAQKRHWWQKK